MNCPVSINPGLTSKAGDLLVLLPYQRILPVYRRTDGQ
jgi:hypothetical protein